MLICSGTNKTPIYLRNFGPVSDAKDWLLKKCRILERNKQAIFLQFQYGGYIRLIHEETLLMAVEMVVSYYTASLDGVDFPPWMQEMDDAWENQCSDDEEEEEEETDSSDEEFYDQWDDN
jgi:hypothetical protein